MEAKLSQVTDIQKGLFYIQKMQPDSAAYNLVFSTQITGDINLTAFQNTLDFIQRQHSILRQTFIEKEGQLFSLDNKTLPLNLTYHDVRDCDKVIQKEAVILRSKQSFDLVKELCMRVDLFHCNEQEHVLLLTAHHASFDFWSLALFLKTFEQAYQAIMADETPVFNESQLQFDQYAEGLIAEHNTEAHQQAKTALIDDLKGYTGVLDLSTDMPRPAINEYKGSSYSFAIPADVSTRIVEAAKFHQVTPYTMLLAVYQVLLHRYTGQEDIVIGSPVAGREKRKLQSVMGNFVNTISLRSQIDESTSFSQLLQQTFKRVIEAIRYQSVPFPQVVEGLNLKRDLGRTPLIQANFSWDKLPQFEQFAHFFSQSECQQSVQWAGLTLSPYWIPQQEGQFDIALEMGAEINGQLTATVKYRDDLFVEDSIQCFALNFIELLDTLSASGEQKIQHVNLMNEQQKHHILGMVDSAIEVSPTSQTLDGLFLQQVNSYPNAIAIQDEHSQLTYAELDAKASMLAKQLLVQHNIAGKRVGVCLPRGIDLVINLLAVLKAGACYVPLDPNIPQARTEMIIEDGQLSLILLDPSLQHLDFSDKTTVTHQQKLLNTTNKENTPNQLIDDVILTEEQGSNSAYVLFTSGSTGRPKGVEVSHANAVNLLASFAQYPGFKQGDSLLAVTTISFDISVLELFLPLCFGGKTIITDSSASASPQALIANIDKFKPTMMQATPASWKMLFDANWQGDKNLTVLCGGEALPKSLAEKLSEHCQALYNVYGPTETTIWSTLSHYTSGDVTIGRPVANTQVYVLDSNLQLVPQGIVGELHIAGDGVSKGYFEQPELTNKVFVENPYGAGLLYKTGDLARLNSHGDFECLGRIGNQVKIRGFRIELDDIEENVRAIQGIKDVAVKAQNMNDDDALVCYFVSEDSTREVTNDTIKKALKAVLPNYMLPAFYVSLPALPMTPNGKIDRKQLPMPELADDQREVLAPRNDIEQQLLVLWQNILKQQHISIDDDFYDIGGHSLLAVQLLANINQQFSLTLDNQFTLSHTTIIDMATTIADGDFTQENSMMIPLNKGNNEHRPLFLMHPIGGTVYCYMAMLKSLDKQLPVYAFQSPGIDDADEAEVDIEAIAAKYVEQILNTQGEGPYRLGGWCFGGVIAYEAASQLLALGKTVESIYVFDTRAPIVANHPEDADDATLLSWFARDLAVPHNKVLDISPEYLREIDEDEQFEYVLSRATEINVIERDADVEKLMNYFQVYIANAMALQMYEEKIVNVPVTLYRALDEPSDYGEFLGWDALTSDNLTVIDIRGDHNSIMYKPYVDDISHSLNTLLNLVDAPCALAKEL